MFAKIELIVEAKGNLGSAGLGKDIADERGPLRIVRSVEIRHQTHGPEYVLNLVFGFARNAAGATQGQVSGRETVLGLLHFVSDAQVLEGIVVFAELG